MIWCWTNAFDIDPALDHHHIKYNYYIMYFIYNLVMLLWLCW